MKKIKQNVNRAIEEITDAWECQHLRHASPRGLAKMNSPTLGKESGHDEKDEDVSEEVTQAKEFHVQEVLRNISEYGRLIRT